MENDSGIELIEAINRQMDNGKTREDIIAILHRNNNDIDADGLIDEAIKYKKGMEKARKYEFILSFLIISGIVTMLIIKFL